QLEGAFFGRSLHARLLFVSYLHLLITGVNPAISVDPDGAWQVPDFERNGRQLSRRWDRAMSSADPAFMGKRRPRWHGPRSNSETEWGGICLAHYVRNWKLEGQESKQWVIRAASCLLAGPS